MIVVVSREGLGEVERMQREDGGKKEKEELRNEKMSKTPFPANSKSFLFFKPKKATKRPPQSQSLIADPRV